MVQLIEQCSHPPLLQINKLRLEDFRRIWQVNRWALPKRAIILEWLGQFLKAMVFLIISHALRDIAS